MTLHHDMTNRPTTTVTGPMEDGPVISLFSELCDVLTRYGQPNEHTFDLLTEVINTLELRRSHHA
jgi:hypothetical protein